MSLLYLVSACFRPFPERLPRVSASRAFLRYLGIRESRRHTRHQSRFAPMSHDMSMAEVTPDDSARQQSASIASPRAPAQHASPIAGGAAQGDVKMRQNTRTFDYIWRSGVAGGMAGCAVSRRNMRLSFLEATRLTYSDRQKHSSRPLTESRSCSRRAAPSSQSTPAPGLESRRP